MKVIITIECDNAAFGETETDCGEELQRILKSAGDMLAEEGPSDLSGRGLYDSNGNRVGNIVME